MHSEHTAATHWAEPIGAVESALAAYFDEREPHLKSVGPELEPVARVARESALSPGKRLRPLFAYWGFRGAGGQATPAVIAACASVELVHACALVHDDVMDGSDTRRGQPAAHRRMETLHGESGWHGDPAAFGSAAAILIGDLLLSWSDSMLQGSGVPAASLARVAPVWDDMRTELMAGQYLDMLEQARRTADVAGALRVARYKSGKYTIERPLHVGAALAGVGEMAAVYSDYGLPLGEAFQLRDDVLGVFGDPARTGKPAGDDIREGKRTALIALTLQRASAAGQAVVTRHLGDAELPDQGLADTRAVIVESGALDEIEAIIAGRTREAQTALEAAEIEHQAAQALADMADAATRRTH